MAQDIVRLPGDGSDADPEQQPAAVTDGAQAGKPGEAAQVADDGERSAAGVLSGLGFGGSGAKPGDAPDGDTPGFVDPPEQIREAARLAPEHWIGYVDPTWAGEGSPPAWALVAQWRSDATGEVVEYQENPEYRPSPSMLGWPEPSDAVEAAIQLAVTGYGPGDDVPAMLAEAEVAVFLQPGGEPIAALAPDGTPVIPVFTAQSHVEAAGRLGFEVMAVADLLDRVPEGHQLYLNAAGPTPMRIEIDPVRSALQALAGAEETAGAR